MSREGQQATTFWMPTDLHDEIKHLAREVYFISMKDMMIKLIKCGLLVLEVKDNPDQKIVVRQRDAPDREIQIIV